MTGVTEGEKSEGLFGACTTRTYLEDGRCRAERCCGSYSLHVFDTMYVYVPGGLPGAFVLLATIFAALSFILAASGAVVGGTKVCLIGARTQACRTGLMFKLAAVASTLAFGAALAGVILYMKNGCDCPGLRVSYFDGDHCETLPPHKIEDRWCDALPASNFNYGYDDPKREHQGPAFYFCIVGLAAELLAAAVCFTLMFEGDADGHECACWTIGAVSCVCCKVCCENCRCKRGSETCADAYARALTLLDARSAAREAIARADGDEQEAVNVHERAHHGSGRRRNVVAPTTTEMEAGAFAFDLKPGDVNVPPGAPPGGEWTDEPYVGPETKCWLLVRCLFCGPLFLLWLVCFYPPKRDKRRVYKSADGVSYQKPSLDFPEVVPAARPGADVTQDDREFLLAFFKRVCPEKAGNVGAILARFEHDRPKLYATLQTMYPDEGDALTACLEGQVKHLMWVRVPANIPKGQPFQVQTANGGTMRVAPHVGGNVVLPGQTMHVEVAAKAERKKKKKSKTKGANDKNGKSVRQQQKERTQERIRAARRLSTGSVIPTGSVSREMAMRKLRERTAHNLGVLRAAAHVIGPLALRVDHRLPPSRKKKKGKKHKSKKRRKKRHKDKSKRKHTVTSIPSTETVDK